MSIGAGWFDVLHLRKQEHPVLDGMIGTDLAMRGQNWPARGYGQLAIGILIQSRKLEVVFEGRLMLGYHG